MNQRHRDDAEAMATSTCHLGARGRRPKRWLPWPVAGTSPSLEKMALDATIQLKKWTEERGGEAHRAEKKTGGGGSEMTADAVGTDGAPVSAALWFGEVGRGELRTRHQ
jgi:hypothetical protein